MSVTRWTKHTASSTPDYIKGIKNPKRSWAKETCNCGDRYKAGVDAAHAKGLFARGVKRVGTKKWKEKALQKGPTRFAEGVYLAGDDYETGFAPYREAISRVDLGPRFPKRDPRNLDRVKKIVTALIAEKLKA